MTQSLGKIPNSLKIKLQGILLCDSLNYPVIHSSPPLKVSKYIKICFQDSCKHSHYIVCARVFTVFKSKTNTSSKYTKCYARHAAQLP